jgi:hypothetical protein
MMRTVMLALALEWLLPVAWCAHARADGGTVRLVEQHGDYQVSVFTAPNPLRAGPVDLSVLVQDTATGQPVPDAQITVTLTAPGRPDTSIRAPATTEAATNKLFRAALVELPHPGEWHVQVTTTTARAAVQSRFTMVAGEPLPPWLTVWPWFGWPAVAVALFGVHRWLMARKS